MLETVLSLDANAWRTARETRPAPEIDLGGLSSGEQFSLSRLGGGGKSALRRVLIDGLRQLA